jgi:hypothetical protein
MPGDETSQMYSEHPFCYLSLQFTVEAVSSLAIV